MLLAEISGNCRKDKDYVMDVDKKDRNEILVAMIIYTLMLVLLGRRLLDLVIWHRIPHSFGVLLAELYRTLRFAFEANTHRHAV